ncbi:MAG: hypothetical protein U0667_12625 [Chloroflexota bacterium]
MRARRAQGTIAILRQHGPLDIEELGRRLALMGATTARDPTNAALDAVRQEPRAFQLMDGRWLDRVAALEGAVLLHRISRLERWRAAIRMDPDLSVLARLVERPSWRRSGPLPGVIDYGWVRDRRLDRHHAAPDRFLAIPYVLARSLQPGDMLRVVVAEGSLTFEPVTGWRDPGATDYSLAEAVAGRVLDAWSQGDPTEPVRVDELVLELAGSAPALLRGLREPVGAVLRRMGLVTHREHVGTAATDWDAHERWEAAVDWAIRDAWESGRDRRDYDPPAWDGIVPDDRDDEPAEDALLDQAG